MVSGKHMAALVIAGALVFSAAAAEKRTPGSPRGPEEAARLLRDMVAAESELRYQGVRQSTGSWSGRSRRVRIYRDGSRRSRIEVLDTDGKPRRIIVRDQDEAPTRSGQEQAGRHQRAGRSRAHRPWRNLDLVLQNYQVRWERDERFLGRPVAVLHLWSQRPDRPRVRLWIDLASKLNVKLERTSPGGDHAFGFEFVELSFPDTFDSELFSAPPDAEERSAEDFGGDPGRRRQRIRRFDSLEGLAPALKTPVLVPEVIPAGFQQVGYSLLEPMGVARIGYSDGLSEISLYEGRRRERTAGGPRRGQPAGEREDERPAGPAEPGGRDVGRRSGRGRRRPGLEGFTEVVTDGVKLQVGRMRGMVFVRRTVLAGDPPVGIGTTVVGEIDVGELQRMSASLVQYRSRRAPGEAGLPGEGRQEESDGR